MLTPLTAWLLACAALAADPVPEIAGRYEMSGYALDKEPAAQPGLYGDGGLDAVRRDLLAAATSDARKALAADFWSSQLTRAYENPRPQFWQACDMTADLIEEILALPVSRSRRRTAAALFGNLQAQVRGAVIDAPRDEQWPFHWSRARAIADRALKDADPRLREHFERFVPLSPVPDWRAEKKRALAAQEKLLAAYPQYDKDLKEVVAVVGRLEREQAKARDDVAAKIKAARHPQGLERKLLRYSDETYAYRFHSLWGSYYPRVIEEALGPEVAASHGLKKHAVKIGWPRL